jgi:6,7-dimethyl-8-ribityllumazine synthase
MSTHAPAYKADEVPPDAKVAVVAARFNEKLVNELLEGCLRKLKQAGLDPERVAVHRVPGAFEIPMVAKALAGTRRYKAVICLGAVVRGDTPHFDYVAGECARGVAAVALAEKLPVIFGVLTTNTEQQAWDRAGGSHGHAGEKAAEAALEMISLIAKITSAE